MSIAKKSHSRPGRQTLDKRRRERSGDDEGKQPAGMDGSIDAAIYYRGLLIRGEAAAAEDGELPAGATHEIVPGENEGDAPKVVRRRYSAF